MKKNQVKGFSTCIAMIAVLIFITTISCGQRIKPTPKAYKSQVLVSSKKYSADSTYLYYALETMLSKNIEPFKPADYYTKSTGIFIDTVLYSPDELKLIVFVITKVASKKEESDNNNSELYSYNANYLFCKRDSIGDNIKIYDYSSFNLRNYKSYKDVKTGLNELCFGRRATSQWSKKEQLYNMDDVRFWDSGEFTSIISHGKFIQLQK